MIIDINTRTNRFSPDVQISPQDLVATYIQKGLDGIVIIEKNKLWNHEELVSLKAGNENFVILRGQEIQTPAGRLLIFGLNEELPDSSGYHETLKDVQSRGGCVVLTHPFSKESPLNGPSQDLVSNHDFIEIYNGNLSKKELRQGLDNYLKYNFGSLGGSEAYTLDETAAFATKFNTPIKTEKDLVDAIKRKKTRPVILGGNDIDPRGGSNKAIEWNIQKVDMMRCEGLLFDIYGTLTDLKSFESMVEFASMAQWLQMEGININGQELYDFYMGRTAELYSYAHENISFPDVDILRVFREAIHTFSGEDRGEEFARRAALIFRALTIQSIKVYPHTRKVLRELRRRGYRMGIISNGQAAFTLPEIEDLKLERFFDFVILSSDAGFSKPEHKIFEIASTQLEIPISRTVMIGDDLHGDIYGAQGAGMKTLLIKSNVQTSFYPVEPDAVITNGDLRNLLRIFP